MVIFTKVPARRTNVRGRSCSNIIGVNYVAQRKAEARGGRWQEIFGGGR